MKYIRNNMQRPGQWTVVWCHKGKEHFVGTYATQELAQQAAWPVYTPVAASMNQLTPLTDRQKTRIINNVVRATKDINLLNKTGYNFLYLAQGFIAHYNLAGFKAHYENGDLRFDILKNARPNMWNNFKPGDANYDYYMAKRYVYRALCNSLDTRPN